MMLGHTVNCLLPWLRGRLPRINRRTETERGHRISEEEQ